MRCWVEDGGRCGLNLGPVGLSWRNGYGILALCDVGMYGYVSVCMIDVRE